MKRKYTCIGMSGFKHGYILPGAVRAYKLLNQSDISGEARRRLKWMDYYREHGRNARLVCRHFGISPDVFYRWKRRYNPSNLKTLEDDKGTRRPHRLRKPEWSKGLIAEVKRLREKYPRWGKDKLYVLIKEKGFKTSVSTVGRIITYLKKTGRLIEPLRLKEARKKRKFKRPWAKRKPAGYEIKNPGDLIQTDTFDLEVLPGIRRKQFTARDYVSKWDTIKVFSQATSRCAKLFLDTLEKRQPFPIKAIQIDGGSEFMGEFEVECKNRGIRLFVLPPRSPKLNGSVERANRTHNEEFYEVYEVSTNIQIHNEKLLRWEETYNYIRPHQALDYLTPAQYYHKCSSNL